MRFRILATAALVAVLASFASVQAQDPTPPPAPTPPVPVKTHGVNLGGGLVFADNSELIFADLIRSAGIFNGYRGVAPIPPYDSAGWPTRVDATTGATSLVVGLNAMLPAGDYTVGAKGTGKITITGSFVGSNPQGVKTLTFAGSGPPQVITRANAGIPYGNQLVLTVVESSATDPLKDLSFVLPGHVGQAFYSKFLDDVRPFSVFRTMDWQVTNGSKLTEWPDREKTRTRFSVQQNGRIGEEAAIDLANTLDKDLWICIPALASDDYIVKLAALFDKGLKAERIIYVEYSNELWNNFPQAGQLGIERSKRPQFPFEVPSKPGTPSVPVVGAWEYIARRDGHATNLFKASLAPERKCVRVLARQAGYQGTITGAIKQYKADGYQFDALACAAYFYAKNVNFDAAATLFKTDPEAAKTQVFNGIDASITEFIGGYLGWWGTLAATEKVRFCCYEGGQHLAASTGNDGPTALLVAVNRDPRMGLAYRKVIDLLPPGTGPICWFNSCGTFSKWGYWGLKERTGQAINQTPKYATIVTDIALNPLPPAPTPIPTPPPPTPIPPIDTLPPLAVPVTEFLNGLKAIGIDGFVKLGDDGAYTATLWDGRPAGFRMQRLTMPTPTPAPVPAPEPVPAPVPAPAPAGTP